jgi:UPF0755 protein
LRSLLLRVAAASAAAATLAVIAAFGWCYQEIHRPYAGWKGEFVDVTIAPGQNAGSMLRTLHQAGVVRRPRVVRQWLALSGGSQELQAGEYRFDLALSPAEVLRRLRSGEVLLHAVTIPEGLVLEETARQIADAELASFEALLAAFRDPAPIRSLDPKAEDLEGYLFPETYHFPRDVGPQAIVAAMVGRFVEVTGLDFRAEAQAVGMSLREAVTLASMIEEETSVGEERARISRVFHNRLERGMRLQCDPTVLYALRRAGRPVMRLYSKHLEFDSPWNTYRVAGLPPGPIASPGEASLSAAVRPGEGDELYFVAAPGGGHQFSSDLGAHLRAVAEWRDYLRSSR